MERKTGRTPLYKQIRSYILDNIKQMNWLPDERIPSENELAAQFKVSRITIKNALAALAEEGLIYRIQGKGSFVSAHPSGEGAVYRTASEPAAAFLMPRLDNRFSANLLNGIENQLAEEGFHLLFCETGDSQETETRLLKQMLRFPVKGIIVYPSYGETYNEELLKLTLQGFPIVVVDRYLKGVETNHVSSDHVLGAFEACSHLIQLGHRRIGFISTPAEGTTSIADRISGYEKALYEHDILIDRHLRLVSLDSRKVNSVFRIGESDAESREVIKQFLAQTADLTAVIAVNSAVGLTVMDAAEEMGLSVPGDLSVVFLDDYELSGYSKIPPTCVSQEEYSVGREAVRLLVSIMEHPQQRRKIMVPPRLIVRQSASSAVIKKS